MWATISRAGYRLGAGGLFLELTARRLAVDFSGDRSGEIGHVADAGIGADELGCLAVGGVGRGEHDRHRSDFRAVGSLRLLDVQDQFRSDHRLFEEQDRDLLLVVVDGELRVMAAQIEYYAAIWAVAVSMRLAGSGGRGLLGSFLRSRIFGGLCTAGNQQQDEENTVCNHCVLHRVNSP